MGSYHVNLGDLKTIGANAIKNAMNSELIAIDEIAPMEFKSPEFIRAVEEALGSDRNMLVVLHQKSNHPVAEKIRKEFLVYTVTPENRERLVSEIANILNKSIDTLKNNPV
ncbi:NTPase [uncultured archaeon]|nr:NTPase [uncultured archaeon]